MYVQNDYALALGRRVCGATIRSYPKKPVARRYVAAAMLTERLSAASDPTSADAQRVKDNFFALMRAQGYLVDRATKPHPGLVPLPPKGSLEEARLLNEIGDELSNALDRSGMSILDLIDRR